MNYWSEQTSASVPRRLRSSKAFEKKTLMPKIPLPSLANLLHAFFHEWLTEQRNVSHRTVLAYRDAWRLFLRFAANRQNKSVAALRLEDLTAGDVLAFLQSLEQVRKASIRTRNCRLAALRSFFS